MKNKKADIWISAALYFGLGVIVVTIILSAGLPLIDRLKDKNVVIETKDVMFTLDDNIRQVIRQGPGEQRVLTIEIKKGDLIIDNSGNMIVWAYTTKALLSEPGVEILEGNLKIITENTNVEKEYKITLTLSYEGLADIRADKDTPNPTQEPPITLSGNNKLIIKNTRVEGADIIVTLNKA